MYLAAQGTMAFRNQDLVGLRTGAALIRILGNNAYGDPVGPAVHDLAPGAEAQAIATAWQKVIDGAFQGRGRTRRQAARVLRRIGWKP